MNQIQTILSRTLDFSTLAVFFLVPWWLRPEWMPDGPYYSRFLIAIPVFSAIIIWVLLGVPGLSAALHDVRRWWIVPFTALAVWVLLSPQWSDFRSQSATAAQQFTLAALFALVAACTGPSARSIAVALAMGLIFQGVIVIAQVQLQSPVGLTDLGEFEIRPFNRGLSIVEAGRDFLMRPYGLTIHPNVIAGYFVVALLCLTGWLVADCDLSAWRKAIRLGVIGLGVWAVCLTFSRSAWGALVIGLALVFVSWFRKGAAKPARKYTLLAAASSVLIIGLFGMSYTKYVWARTGEGGDTTEERSISDRRLFIGIALQVAYEHPVIGIGIGAFPWVSNDIINAGPYRGWLRGDNVHDVPLLVLTELGLVGLTMWLLTLAAGLIVVWRTVYDPFAVGLAVGAVALLAIGVLDHYPWSIFHFLLLLWTSLAVALRHSNRVLMAARL